MHRDILAHLQLNLYAAADAGRKREAGNDWYMQMNSRHTTISSYHEHAWHVHIYTHTYSSQLNILRHTYSSHTHTYSCVSITLRHRPWRNFCCDVRGERLCHRDLVDAMGKQLAESPWFKQRVRAQRYPVPTRISTHVRSVATSVLARRKTSPSV